MSADPAAGNRPHIRPEFDQIRFNCAAGRSPNVLETHARTCVRVSVRVRECVCVCARARAYMREGASRVTRYDAVSRDNAGMQGDRRIHAWRSGLRGANTFSCFARWDRIDKHACVCMRIYILWRSLAFSLLSFSLFIIPVYVRLHFGTHYLQAALITPSLPLALARLIRMLLNNLPLKTDQPGPPTHG